MAHQPYITYIPKEYEYNLKNELILTTKFFHTYAQLKKEVKALLEDSFNNEVHIVRERRGKWGEWFEYWSMYLFLITVGPSSL